MVASIFVHIKKHFYWSQFKENSSKFRSHLNKIIHSLLPSPKQLMNKFNINFSDQVGARFLQKAKVVLGSAVFVFLFLFLISRVPWGINLSNDGESVASKE